LVQRNWRFKVESDACRYHRKLSDGQRRRVEARGWRDLTWSLLFTPSGFVGEFAHNFPAPGCMRFTASNSIA
jgi:hypothetical protein